MKKIIVPNSPKGTMSPPPAIAKIGNLSAATSSVRKSMPKVTPVKSAPVGRKAPGQAPAANAGRAMSFGGVHVHGASKKSSPTPY